ncbi:hypothetical protein [Erythrobacter sp. F6033]|uniref:hypothetical protein n=1 Tax=Erythrobacter sp. F6033 TaxID=2926401 RepID=UPI001FF2988A|nr:hypothetical protein [Erythrobacter sp. F6033]MCK0127418.1 hypothetical protein [Erythrobacter sp. F6033]
MSSNWVRIAETPEGSVYYIDADQKGKGRDEGGPYVVADFIIDESKNASKKQASTFLKYHVRCGPQMYKLVHLATFDKQGKTLQAGDVTGRLAEIPYAPGLKGTISGTVVRRACEVANSK